MVAEEIQCFERCVWTDACASVSVSRPAASVAAGKTPANRPGFGPSYGLHPPSEVDCNRLNQFGRRDENIQAFVAASCGRIGFCPDRRRSACSGRCFAGSRGCCVNARGRFASAFGCVVGSGCLCPCRRGRSCGEGDGEPVCGSLARRLDAVAGRFDRFAGKPSRVIRRFSKFAGKPDGVAWRLDRRPQGGRSERA